MWKRKQGTRWERSPPTGFPPASTPICITNSPIATSPTETEIRPEFNTEDKFTAAITVEEELCTTTITRKGEEEEARNTIKDATIDNEFITSTTTEEEVEEVRITIEHKFYTRYATTNEASDTTTCITTIIDNATIDAISSTSTITISDTVIESPTTREVKEEVCTTNLIFNTLPIIDTTTCDDIDNKILQTEYEGTIVFEDYSSAPTTVHTANPSNIIINDLSTTEKFDTIVRLLNEDTLDFVCEMLSEDPCDEDTREVVYGIIMEALLSLDDVVVDGAGVVTVFLRY